MILFLLSASRKIEKVPGRQKICTYNYAHALNDAAGGRTIMEEQSELVFAESTCWKSSARDPMRDEVREKKVERCTRSPRYSNKSDNFGGLSLKLVR